MSLDPKTREEQYLSAIANGSEVSSVAVTREEKFLRGILNGEPPALKPITRKEMFYKAIAEGGTPGGGSSGGSSGGNTGGDNFPIGDGNTHIWISLIEGRTSPMVGVGVKGTVTVDWGDGSEPDTLTGTKTTTAVYTPVHEYGKAGDYVITLSGDGEIGITGMDGYYNGSSLLLASSTSLDILSFAYRNAIKKVELGNRVTSIGNYAFMYCYSLAEIVIPDGVMSIGNYAFEDCHDLFEIVVLNGVTVISGLARNCHRLVRVFVSSSVTQVKSNAFSACYTVAFYDFTSHTSVPALSDTNSFQNNPSDCIFRIPASLYDEWINATNWSSIAASYTFVGV